MPPLKELEQTSYVQFPRPLLNEVVSLVGGGFNYLLHALLLNV